MKRIIYRYNLPLESEDGTLTEQLFEKTLPWSEAALQILEQEAHLGEYTVEDDGLPEPENDSIDEVLNVLLGVAE